MLNTTKMPVGAAARKSKQIIQSGSLDKSESMNAFLKSLKVLKEL